MNATTADLSEFGARELIIAATLLINWSEGELPEDFIKDEIKIVMNKESGNVFLSNKDCQVCMLNGDKLEMFYSCPHCGDEGYANEISWSKRNNFCSKCSAELFGIYDY